MWAHPFLQVLIFEFGHGASAQVYKVETLSSGTK